ncbi:hypothetical protein HDU93_008229, partial [Gonapodya sp. JEL0774]
SGPELDVVVREMGREPELPEPETETEAEADAGSGSGSAMESDLSMLDNERDTVVLDADVVVAVVRALLRESVRSGATSAGAPVVVVVEPPSSP